MLLAHMYHHNWEIETLDVKTTFLYEKLDEEIYMEQPKGFWIKAKEKKVYQLQQALFIYAFLEPSSLLFQPALISLVTTIFISSHTDKD